MEKGHLADGDILVLDNACVHTANEIIPHAQALVDSVGARIVFLPTYSSELDPCELVFGCLKTFLRNNYSRQPLWLQTLQGLATITKEKVHKFYDHSIRGWMKDV